MFVNLKLPVVASFYNSKRRERIIVNAIFFVIVVGDWINVRSNEVGDRPLEMKKILSLFYNYCNPKWLNCFILVDIFAGLKTTERKWTAVLRSRPMIKNIPFVLTACVLIKFRFAKNVNPEIEDTRFTRESFKFTLL